MAQQTAIEWFYKQLYETPRTIWEEELNQIREQANQMFQEQIMKAFSDGQETPLNNPTLPHYSREEYFKEKYKR